MIKNLRTAFFQVFTCSLVWITVLMTLFFSQAQIPFIYIWNVIGIAAVFGLMFGVLYSLLWNYLTLKPVLNIFISSVFNTIGGLIIVFLFSVERFFLIAPWIPGIFMLTLILHAIVFYFYAAKDAKKNAKELNKLMQKK